MDTEIRKIHVLLVDDDAVDRRLVELALKKPSQAAKFIIKTAQNLEKAVEFLENGNFDFVLLDLGLPDSYGLETIEKIRQAHSNIPIIVLTGLEDEQTGIMAIQKGAIDYVTKPFKESGLRTRIGIALQIVKLQKKLLLLANTDELTGLANYRHFFGLLEREILAAKIKGYALTVLMCDIDHFKSVNDTYGHQGGDEVIKQLAKIIRENIYPLDIAARYAGDEFVVLMPQTTLAKGMQAAHRLRKVIDNWQWKVSDKRISVTSSIGMVNIDSRNLLDPQDIVEKADTALLAAKRQGRNCVVRWDEIDGKAEPQIQADRHYHELQTKVSSMARQLHAHSMGTISALTEAMNMVLKDPYIIQHGKNVRSYATAIAEEMGISTELTERIGTAALLQDLGNISIPAYILKKETELNEEERNIIRQHPLCATRILESIPIFNLELQTIKHHHENFDGTGYPTGLKGREIPIGARIITVADAFDAITSNDGHRPPRSKEEALREIAACAGTQFDPEVTEALIKACQKHKEDWPLSTPKPVSLPMISQ